MGDSRMHAVTETEAIARPPRVLSGMRPTARLHLGNLEGALRAWSELQATHECFYVVADWHALTTNYERNDELCTLVREMVLDWCGAGLDPSKCTIFVQSDVPEHAELALLLGMMTPVPWLERSVTYKEWMAHTDVARSAGLGLLAYPVLQAADILVHRATTVPVGKDQAQHIEVTRDIARRFNALYGDVLPVPEPHYSEFAALPGTDGRKMSKTYGNVIHISDPPPIVERRIAMMFTDPAKVYKGDKGHPERCPAFTYHRCYNAAETEFIEGECKAGALGCVECKAALAARVVAALAPIQDRRRDVDLEPGALADLLAEGARRARESARQTLDAVREAMGLWHRTAP